MTIIDFLDGEPPMLLIKPAGEETRYVALTDNQLSNLATDLVQAMARRVRIPLKTPSTPSNQ